MLKKFFIKIECEAIAFRRNLFLIYVCKFQPQSYYYE